MTIPSESYFTPFKETPFYQIEVPGFSCVWLKDESFNPTGTHKDRLAMELADMFKRLISARQTMPHHSIPRMSLISSGSAALAIQIEFQKRNLPNLKVLADKSLTPAVVECLTMIGCELYQIDLHEKALTPKEILESTENFSGYDITSFQSFALRHRCYDSIAYEIIDFAPDYCFIPFGSGTLYENILEVYRKEVSKINHALRFTQDIRALGTCNFMGVTTKNPHSKAAEKLYSPFLPFTKFSDQWIRFYREFGFCGTKSDVCTIEEKYLDDALLIAEDQNIRCEPSAISGLGLLLQMNTHIQPDSKIVIINTGKALYNSRFWL